MSSTSLIASDTPVAASHIASVDTAPASPSPPAPADRRDAVSAAPLRWHYAFCVFLYGLAGLLSWWLLHLSGATANALAVLTTGALLATFGSAIGALGGVWERDLLERVQTNLDILHRDILKEPTPWRRWPFLSRVERTVLPDGTKIVQGLRNGHMPLPGAMAPLSIAVPSVLDDFFDLPLLPNVLPLILQRNAVRAKFYAKDPAAIPPADSGLQAWDWWAAYECMRDTWLSVASFRLARYVIHLGAALTMLGVVATVWQLAWLHATRAWEVSAPTPTTGSVLVPVLPADGQPLQAVPAASVVAGTRATVAPARTAGAFGKAEASSAPQVPPGRYARPSRPSADSYGAADPSRTKG